MDTSTIGIIIVMYALFLVGAVVGWVGNLIHAFGAVGNDLLWSVVGVFIPFIGIIKFYFF